MLFAFVFTGVVAVYGQQLNDNYDVKYVIFTSDKKAEETGEGIYRYTSKVKSDDLKFSPIGFHIVSKVRGIHCMAYHFGYDLEKLAKHRKITEKDKRVIKETTEAFLDSVNLIDIDLLFPKMTKDEFTKFWDNNLHGNSPEGKNVYFIDRSEIKNHKVILYPVNVVGINQY